MAKTNTSAFFVESIPVNFTCDQVNSQDKDGYDSVFGVPEVSIVTLIHLSPPFSKGA